MLDAYKNKRALDELEAQLPENVEQVRHDLEILIQDQPSDLFALLLLGRCQVLCNDRDDAKETFTTLLKLDPNHVAGKVEMAKLLFSENAMTDALKLLTDVTNTRPDFADNWKLLSEYLQLDGQMQASKNAYTQYDLIKAFNDNLESAGQAFSESEYERADTICRKLLNQVPNEARALHLLARLARQFNHLEISTSILARCIETKPADAAMGLDYIRSLSANRKYLAALEQCDRLTRLIPENIDVYEHKAEVLFNLSRYEESIAIYRELSSVDEKRALSLLHLGKVQTAVGETEEAINCFHRAMESDPLAGHTYMPGQAYWELSNLKTYRFSNDEIESMKDQLNTGDISTMNKILLQFALGRALEDAGQFAESFQYFQSANSGYRELRPSRYINQNAKLKPFFTREYFSEHRKTGSDSEAPVFVVGLPRSGSTLVEQILTSHSQVDSTQELTEIISIARELEGSNLPGQDQYTEAIAKLGAREILDLAQRYLDYARIFRQQGPYFVDKAPGNFHHIGLIKTLFPKAKIIDIRRNPLASGWSLYKHFFSDSFLFSYDLEAIGKYYNDYIEIMDHWHTVIPGEILTLEYEDLVNDLPAAVDSLLQYCGLPFEDSCLNFHLSKRPVATPSSEQVRQPLYTSAVEHWKNYDAYLTPLKQTIKSNDLSPAA